MLYRQQLGHRGTHWGVAPKKPGDPPPPHGVHMAGTSAPRWISSSSCLAAHCNLSELQSVPHWEAQPSIPAAEAAPQERAPSSTLPSSGNGHSSIKQLKIWLHLTAVLSETKMSVARGCQLDCSGELYLEITLERTSSR